jgi:exopolysaccharide biosynthesis polyprenyl glycosylphosphotransferase
VTKQQAERRAFLVTLDFLLASGIMVLAVRLRFGPEFSETWSESLRLPSLLLVAVAFGVVSTSCLGLVGVYRSEAYIGLGSLVLDIARGVVLLALVTLSALFLLKLGDVSRLALAISLTMFGGMSISIRGLLRRWDRKRDSNDRRARWLVVGWSPGTPETISELQRYSGMRPVIVGVLDDEPIDSGYRYLGEFTRLSQVLAGEIVDEVIVCIGRSRPDLLEQVIAAAQVQGKAVRMPVDPYVATLWGGRVEHIGNVALWTAVATPERRIGLAAKRLLDVAGALVLLIGLAPLIALAATACLFGQGRPLLFGQPRAGLHGRPFRALKFRTMVNGAEADRSGLLHLNERIGPVFKIGDDPRVTKLGRWLRLTSIDEVPQLFNVLRGDMSLVGPRPQPLVEVTEYTHEQRRRLSMKPGITGLWQVSARNDPDFASWIKHDLEYIDGWSFWLDVKILGKTPLALVRSPGM